MANHGPIQLRLGDMRPGDEFEFYGNGNLYRISDAGRVQFRHRNGGPWVHSVTFHPEREGDIGVRNVVRADPAPHAFTYAAIFVPPAAAPPCGVCGNPMEHASHVVVETHPFVQQMLSFACEACGHEEEHASHVAAARAPRVRVAAVKQAIANALDPKPVEVFRPGEDHASLVRAGVAAMERRVAAERALRGPSPITCQPNHTDTEENL